MHTPEQPSRRRFIQRGVLGTSLVGLGSGLGLWSSQAAAPKPPVAGSGRTLGKEFTYDITPFQKTDPKLVLYKETGAIPLRSKEARAVAVGPDGTVLVAGEKAIARFKPGGDPDRVFTLNDTPRCLAMAGDGLLYAGMKDRVVVLDREGKPQSEWPGLNAKTVLTCLAVTEQDVFAADAGNRLVLRYDRSGKPIGQIGRKDAARNVPGFVVPSPYFDCAVGPEGLLWVANPGQHRLEAYTLAGDFELSWGEFGNDLKRFCGCCNPAHFAMLPDGRFITSEKGLVRVKLYSPKGQFEGVVAGSDQFASYLEVPTANPTGLDVAVDSAGRVLLVDARAGAVRIFSPKASL